MNTPISRRDLLKFMAALAGGVGLAGVQRMLTTAATKAPAASLTPQSYLPFISRVEPTATPTVTPTRTPTPTHTPTRTATPTSTIPAGSGPKVIHIHSTSATDWDFSPSTWYGNHVSQSKVNEMADRGVKEVTGQSTVAAAWNTLLPGYAAGKGIAIKVNFNNSNTGSDGCSDSDNIIDALIQPVNALIQGMKLNGVREQDIWIYDAIRAIPARFRNGCLYSGVHFVDSACAEAATFDSTAADASVTFANSNLHARHLADVLINATYLINMPIIKEHGISGVSLGFKHHFGTLKYVIGAGADNLHEYIDPNNKPTFRADYNPLVEINQNPHIRDKTVLTVGDGLYGALGNTNVAPTRWQSFGNAACNSLFFSRDPVALDCVMMDLIYAENNQQPGNDDVDDYLKLAAAAGLGVFEHGDPWGSGYTNINYTRINL